jgi:hypothetical protein
LTVNSSESRIRFKCQRREGRTLGKTLSAKNFNRWWNANGFQGDTAQKYLTLNLIEFRFRFECQRWKRLTEGKATGANSSEGGEYAFQKNHHCKELQPTIEYKSSSRTDTRKTTNSQYVWVLNGTRMTTTRWMSSMKYPIDAAQNNRCARRCDQEIKKLQSSPRSNKHTGLK